MRTFITIILFLSTMHDTVLLEARYTPVPGTSPEYAQGAIERNDLRHREIEPFVWVILVDAPADPAEWQRKLCAAVDPKHGSFTVRPATAEEEEALRAGNIALQR